MDIRNLILEEHSKEQCNKIVEYIGADEKRFAKLMLVFFGDDRASQRAAWPLGHCIVNHPHLIKPYLGKLVELLEDRNVRSAMTRNITRLLQHVEIPKKFHGRIMNACFNFIADVKTPVAIKAFSLTLLDNLSRSYPEIIPELLMIIKDRWPNETAAFRSRARKILHRQKA